VTKQKHRTTTHLLAIWDSLSPDQKVEFINSDDITAVEVMRLDRAGRLDWSSLTQ
jgi:hypothetical protein